MALASSRPPIADSTASDTTTAEDTMIDEFSLGRLVQADLGGGRNSSITPSQTTRSRRHHDAHSCQDNFGGATVLELSSFRPPGRFVVAVTR